MIIAIDFDGTYTSDPPLWDAFISNARVRGHCVVCVTCRRLNSENVKQCDVPGVLTYFTGGAAKDWYLREQGIVADVWIDDEPNTVLCGK